MRPGRISARRSVFALFALLALTLALSFLTVPVISVFTNTSPGELVSSLGESSARDALWLSFRTSLIALLIIVVVGTPSAYLLATRSFRGRSVVMTLIELPLVMPPAVAGIALLAALGPRGIIGGAIEDSGIQLVLETTGVIVALTFVASPFFLRQAQAAFSAIDPSLLDASRTLGSGEGRTFLRVAVPSARAGLSAGLALAWGRALGEFGATLMFAGSFQGVTQTAPLAIFEQFTSEDGFTTALALSAVLIAASGAILLAVKLLAGSRTLSSRGV